MALRLEALRDDVAAGMTDGVGQTRFDRLFVIAYNLAVDELSTECDLATPIAHIAAAEGNADAQFDTDDYAVIYWGLRYKLMQLGVNTSDPKLAALALQSAAQEWQNQKGNYEARELNELQSDSDNDVIGFGASANW